MGGVNIPLRFCRYLLACTTCEVEDVCYVTKEKKGGYDQGGAALKGSPGVRLEVGAEL